MRWTTRMLAALTKAAEALYRQAAMTPAGPVRRARYATCRRYWKAQNYLYGRAERGPAPHGARP